MSQNLLIKAMKPLIGVFIFLLRKAISLAVRMSIAAESHSRRRACGETDAFSEPEFIRRLLRFCLPERKREIVIGCLVEHYRKIYEEAGKDKADKWLYEEMVKSLECLILRWETVTYAWATFRQIFGTQLLTVKLRNIKSRCASSSTMFSGKLHSLKLSTVSAALVSLITVIVVAPVWWGTLEPNIADGEVSYPGPQEEVSLNRIPELKTPEPLPPSALPTTPPTAEPARRTVKNNRPVETPTTALPEFTLNNFSRERDLEEDGNEKEHDAKAPKTRTRFSLRLSPSSDKGTYTVSLVDGFGKPLVTKRARSSDGKSLSVVLDLKGVVPNRRYYISVSRKGGVPDFYPVVINPK